MLTAVLIAVLLPNLAVGVTADDLDGGSALVDVLTADMTDSDGDGLLDAVEWTLGTDPTRDDTDSDGLPDSYELWMSLNPLSALDAVEDLDGDGLDNMHEFQLGSLPFEVDTDGDRFWDGIELARGSDPLAEGSYPSSAVRSDVNCDGLVNASDVQLVLNGVLGKAVPVPINVDYISTMDSTDIQLVVNGILGKH